MFDLDGTLLDTLADLASSMNAALRVHGFAPHDTDAYRTFVGDGVENLARRALPADARDEVTIARCVEEMRRVYSHSWAVRTRPYDGIPQTLDRLATAGIAISILSNKPHDMTVKIVEAMLGDWEFARVDGARPGIPRKPDATAALASCCSMGVAPAEVAYVGDTDTDMKTAVGAGMLAVGALWGFRDKAELIDAGAETTIRHPAQVLELFD
jgi:phosphoglycolate phosphatase